MSEPKRVTIRQPRGKPIKVVCDLEGHPVINDYHFLAWHMHTRRFFIGRTDPTQYAGRDLASAIAQFRQFLNKQHREQVALETSKTVKTDDVSLDAAFRRDVEVTVDHDGSISVASLIDSDIFWDKVRTLILTNPDLVAEKTGIKRIARLDSLPEPETYSLQAILDHYLDKTPPISTTERRHTKTFWRGFIEIVGVSNIEDVKQEHIEQYKNKLLETQPSEDYDPGDKYREPSYVNKRFSKIKTIITHADKMLLSPNQTKRILSLLTILQNLTHDDADPTPISKTDLHKLLKVATTEERFMVLLGLNCAFYPKDVRLLKKSDLDLEEGIFAGRRQKRVKGKRPVQCSVLWERTIQAARDHLKENPNPSEYLLISQVGTPYAGETFRKNFAKLRDRAGVSEDIHFDHLRDGAASHSGLDKLAIQILLGHTFSGEQGKYILARAREHTETACKTLESYYF